MMDGCWTNVITFSQTGAEKEHSHIFNSQGMGYITRWQEWPNVAS